VISTQARLTTIRVLLALLGLATLISIVVALSGIQSEGMAKLSVTSSLFVLFAATFLISAISFERNVLPGIGVVGMGASLLAFLLALLHVYGAIAITSFGALRPVLIFGLLALVGAWASAVAAQHGDEGPVEAVVWGTVGALGLLALVGLILIVSESQPGSGVGKLVTVLGSLATLGTFAAPMLRKAEKLRTAVAAPPPSADPEA